MRSLRIIPRLDIKGPNLVKGVHLEGLRVLGKPEDFAYQYYLDGADELIYMDIVASLYGRNNLLDIVRQTAKKIFIPLTVGGGIRTMEDIRGVLRAGADKVAINTAAIQNHNIIKEGAKTFGSQCIVVSMEVRKNERGHYEIFTDNGRQETGVDVFKWARAVCDFGAGEILLTSIDRDGTGTGYDIELVSKVSEIVPIPVIASGGAGSIDDVEKVIKLTKVSAVSAASVFHYNRIDKALPRRHFEEGNVEFLKEYSKIDKYRFKRIKPFSIFETKTKLAKNDDMRIRMPLSTNDEHAISRPSRRELNGSYPRKAFIAVVDYGCGNLFSIEHALKAIDARFTVTSDPKTIMQADKLLLPGVGAFGSGMHNLREINLVDVIIQQAERGKPILGICLGMQLLMSESEEFGLHKGLGLIKGKVVKLKIPENKKNVWNLRIPHIGWSQVRFPNIKGNIGNAWKNTILAKTSDESLMYFVHSYVVEPYDKGSVLAESDFGNNTFSSVIRRDNIYGCQFHPERSGEKGLGIYREFAFGTNNNKATLFENSVDIKREVL